LPFKSLQALLYSPRAFPGTRRVAALTVRAGGSPTVHSKQDASRSATFAIGPPTASGSACVGAELCKGQPGVVPLAEESLCAASVTASNPTPKAQTANSLRSSRATSGARYLNPRCIAPGTSAPEMPQADRMVLVQACRLPELTGHLRSFLSRLDTPQGTGESSGSMISVAAEDSESHLARALRELGCALRFDGRG
jgi:hypothetical protein